MIDFAQILAFLYFYFAVCSADEAYLHPNEVISDYPYSSSNYQLEKYYEATKEIDPVAKSDVNAVLGDFQAGFTRFTTPQTSLNYMVNIIVSVSKTIDQSCTLPKHDTLWTHPALTVKGGH